jgi:hypothetical protein
MQYLHRIPAPIAGARVWLPKAFKQLATLRGRKRQPAHVPRAGLRLV